MTSPVLGARLPELRTPIPGPASRAMAERLRRVESRNVTYMDEGWPIFWEDARGANVVDADGNVFVDLTSAFGVGLLGHRSDPLEHALAEQGLVHGMGDIHPPAVKLELLERLAGISPWNESRVVLASTGSEAVEIGLKTGALVSGRPGVLAFHGAYHGLTLGSLAATPRPHFRALFEERLYGGVAFAPFPDPLRDQEAGGMHSLRTVEELLDRGAPNGDAIGTIVVEPVQARGGARVPPNGFMSALSDLAESRGVTMVADEIFTGIGRCGAMLASERVGLRPDIVCIGKALGAGLPISACVGSAEVMDTWPASSGEAIHTSTFLGHPLACAAAIRVLDAMADGAITKEIDRLGESILAGLRARLDGVEAVGDIRGLGLLLGIELIDPDRTTRAQGAGVRIAERILRDGIISLPAGDVGEVFELTPPVVLTDEQRDYALDRVTSAIVADT